MLSFRNIHTKWWLEVIASHDIVNIVDSSGSESDLGEITGPDSSVGILSLILGIIGGIDVIVNESVSFIPFLIVILLEVMMGGVDGEVLANPSCQFKLFVHFIQKQVVFFTDHSVAVGAVSGENLEAYDKIQQG